MTTKMTIYRALRYRGDSAQGAWRTMRRGTDAVALAIKLRDALGQDGATAVLTGLLNVPFGAQRAAAVLRRWVPEGDMHFPSRNVGQGVHAGAFGSLIRRALKAVPHVGDAPADAPRSGKDALAAIKATISVMKTTVDFSSPWLQWDCRTWRAQKGARHVHVQTLTFRHGAVTLTVAEEEMAHFTPRWVARAEVGGFKFDALALAVRGIETAV